ncbi:MAG: methylmalonyl-CoA mutase [Planctomycetota bacterium]|jgi:methylmalonyl-CoA mutase
MTDTFPKVNEGAWRQRVEAELKGADFDRVLKPESFEGFAPDPLYIPDGTNEPTNDSPGSAPFRRGYRPEGAPGVTWRITQRHALPHLDDLEQAVLDDQAGGANGVWLVFDRAARLGMDADDSASIEHCGVEGAPIHELSQLDQIIGGLDLEQTRVHLDAGANALPAASLFFAICRIREISGKKISVRLDADPIGALARDGEIPGDLVELISEAAHMARDLGKKAKDSKTFRVSTECWQEAGMSTVQEIGVALATGVAYLRALEDAGFTVEEAANQICFRIPMGRDLFSSIAKIRALRSCWHLILRSCDIESPEPSEFHAVPSRRTLTRLDPWVNMLRGTSQTLAAVVGGADEIASPRYDEMAGPSWWPRSMQDFVEHAPPLQNSYERSGTVSSALGRRVARNTQVILGEEAHIGQVADPAGGSYYVESLTDELITRGWAQFQDIEIEGGAVAALRNGTLQKLAQERLAARSGRLRRRRDPITGVSEYADLQSENDVHDGSRLGDAVASARQHLLEHKQTRGRPDSLAINSLFEGIDAAIEGATIGEISRQLIERDEAEMIKPLHRRRDSDDFEELRDFASKLTRTSSRPRVLLVPVGKLTSYGPRVTFANNFFAAGGIETVLCPDDECDPVAFWKKSGCEGICICGSDRDYESDAGELAKNLRKEMGGNHPLMLAGRPEKLECELPETIVPIYMGCDLIHILGGLLYLSEAAEKGGDV